MSNQQTHPSRLILDQLFGGQGVDEQVRDHLRDCPRCTARLQRMRADYADYLARYPSLDSLPARAPAATPRASQHDKGAGQRLYHWLKDALRPPPRRWGASLAGVLVVTALALWVVLPVLTEQSAPRVRSKGASILELTVLRAGQSRAFSDQPLRAGDVLAFRYTTRHRFLLLVSVEDSGAINDLIFDEKRQQSLAIPPGRQRPLAQGIELDTYVGAERLIALFSAAPLKLPTVHQELARRFKQLSASRRRQLALGQLPLAAEQLFWLIHKVP